MHYYMVYILHIILNYNSKFAITRRKDANSNYAPDESFVAIYALAERLPTSATLSSTTLIDGRYIVISTLLAPLSTGQPECREAGSPVPSGPRFCQRSALPATGATYDGR